MTCIVGVLTPTGVIIGGDSGGLSGYTLMHRADPKVFTNDDYLIGFTSSFRMGQLLRYADLPKVLDRTGDDLDRFMSTDAVRKVLKDGGFAKKDSEQEEGGVFLIGVSGRLFRLESDYQIGWTTDGYEACGSGQDVASGVLHVTRRSAPLRRVRCALEAAEHHNAGVHGPFTNPGGLVSTCTTPGHEDRHRPEHAFICGGCSRGLKDDLAAAATLWDELTITLTRQDVIGGDGGRRSAETSLAFKANASEAMWVLASTLGSVAADLADTLGMQFPLHPVRWLGANLDKLAGTSEAGRLVDEVRSACRLAWATIDRPPALLFAGMCTTPDCSGVLYAKPGDGGVQCPECDRVHSVVERRERMVAAAAVLNVSKTVALSWVSLLMDRSIPDGTWRQWRSRGRLRVHALSVEGSELFRFGDVRDLAITWMSRKKAA